MPATNLHCVWHRLRITVDREHSAVQRCKMAALDANAANLLAACSALAFFDRERERERDHDVDMMGDISAK